MTRDELVIFNPKTAGEWEGGGVSVCSFLKNVSSRDRVKLWFFVTFNFVLRHFFPENFIEFPQVMKKDMKKI